MIRNTFAIAALLGLQETQAIELSSHQTQKSTTSDKGISFSDEVQLAAKQAKMGAGCWDGIKRWNATSESWETFKNAHGPGAGMFEDKSFDANLTSLYNSKYLEADADADA